MANSNTVAIDVSVQTTGDRELDALLAKMRGAGADVAPFEAAARRLGTQLKNLEDQQQLINVFTRAKEATGQAAQGMQQAQAAAQRLGRELSATAEPTKAQTKEFERARKAVADAKQEWIGSVSALEKARGALDQVGIQSGKLALHQTELRKSAAQAHGEMATLAQKLQAVAGTYTATGNAADSSGQTMQRSHRRVAEGVDSISVQLQRVQSAYLALQGGGTLGGMVKSALETADAYKNLEARIQLATVGGGDFKQAMAGVSDIALRTNSSLESTGTLFARLTDAGKNAGLSAQAAQEQALDLAESINQAVQLSGASAQASDAAITQLIQGLQGGVLRGEEFNSIMEQAPRLSKALAQGLGVTTGELRKMSEAGQLSAETVIKAIQSQSAILKSEFASLPATVGRSVQNLSTAWTVYIGNLDKATEASGVVARAIDVLAKNLDTVAGYLIDAGQAAAAFAALRLAQTFLGLGTAAAGSATAVAANAAAITTTNAAAATTAATLGRFATVLATLRTFTLIGLVANFKDIGTWIGEGIAKLQGYKDKSAELEAQDKRNAQAANERAEALRAQAAATEAAQNAQFGLSKEAATLIAKFQQLTKDGKASADAIKEIGKDFDLASIPGIKNAAAVLNKLAADGRISASEFQKAWADALKGEDLLTFEAKAKAALEGTARGAERLAQVNDAILRESVHRVADTYNVLAGNSSAAAKSAINDTELMIKGLDKLKAQGVDTAAALTASIGKGINTASTQKDLDTIKDQVEQVRKVLGDKVANGLLDQAKQKAEELRQKLEDLTPGIQGAKEAMRQLGITSDEELKKVATSAQKAYDVLKDSGTASARELQEAFKKAAQAAIDANNGVAPSWVTAQAATRGYRVEVDEAGKATLALASANKKAEDGMRGQAAATDTATSALERQIQAQEKANQLAERAADLERKRRGVDKDGFSTDKNGNRLVAGSDLGSLTGIAAFLKSAGVADDAVARNIAREFADEKGNVIYANNPGQRKYGGDTLSVALLKAAETYTFGIGSNAKQTGVGQQPSTIPAQPAKTYNVTIGGQTVRTVSDADAQTLMQLLAQAQRAA